MDPRQRKGRTGRRAASPALALTMALWMGLAVGCASAPTAPGAPGGPPARAERAAPGFPGPAGSPSELARRAVRAALAVVGTPYRYGGRDPDRGFDCSGLVTWSYERAGLANLPRTAEGLERAARPVSFEHIEPGDLVFFRLRGKKSAHVALYVGDDRFVHAPSTGRQVEVVHLDHVFWSRQPRRAGRIAH